MSGAGIHQFTGLRIEYRADGGGASSTWEAGGEAVQTRESETGTRTFEQQRAARAAQLTHDGGGGKAVSDTVADDQADTPVVQIDNVVPVAAYL